MRKVCPTGYTMMRGVCKEMSISRRPRSRDIPGCCSQGPGEISYICSGGVMHAWTWMCTDGATYNFESAQWANITPCYHDGSVSCTCVADCSGIGGSDKEIPGVAPPKGKFRRGGRLSRMQRTTSKSRVQLNNNRNWIQVNSTTFKWNGNGLAPTAHGYYITCRDHDNQVSHQIECHVSHTGGSMHEDCPNPPCYDFGTSVAVCDGACHGEQVGISPIARVGGRIRRRRKK
tara:strand:+ start:3403 stop:4095 length:693 start_codon:yes stop_codon:yes gene_type:complete